MNAKTWILAIPILVMTGLAPALAAGGETLTVGGERGDLGPLFEPAVVVAQPYHPACVLSIEDVAVTNQCTLASSQPRLGRLYPITQDLFVAPTGEVGIGTTQPGAQLTVDGVIHSTSGGFRFPDGNVQTTARATGDPGPQGDVGPQGPPGNPGDPGTPGVTHVSGLGSSFLSLTASGGATVSSSFNTITVSAPSVACTYENQTYSTGQSCYTWPDGVPCTVGFRQLRLLCQSNGSWQVITSSACNNPSLGPICGN